MTAKTILVTSKTNIRYFSGFTGSKGCLVFKGKKKFIFVDARYRLVAKTQCPKSFKIIDTTDGFEEAWRDFLKKHNVRRLGFEGNNVSFLFWKKLKKISKGVRLVDIGDKLDMRRAVKKPAELRLIRHAQKITDGVFAALKKWLKAGVSEKEIEWKIECLARERGASGLSFQPIVAINEHSAAPHHQNTRKKLKPGDLLLIDMGARCMGWCSDMTRVIFTSKPTAEQTLVYKTVLKAQRSAISKIKEGITGAKADAAARAVIEKAGFGKNFGHASGHGVGLDIHELPNLAKKYRKRIPAGAVITVEPGIYLPDKFGVRIEDMISVRKNSVLNLTKSPKSIQANTIKLK